MAGFGFIDFATEEDAINALNGYNGRPIRCRPFLVSFCSGNRLHIPSQFRWEQQELESWQ